MRRLFRRVLLILFKLALLIAFRGRSDNQVIWVTALTHDPKLEAFALVDSWMLNILARTEADVIANKPMHVQHHCYSADGIIIARGSGVWNGELNNSTPGACMKVYPAFRTSREVTGGGAEADIFKYPIYAALLIRLRWVFIMVLTCTELEQVFPDGVFNYRLGDAPLPEDFWESMRG